MRITKLLRPLGATLLMFLATSCGPKKDAQKKLPDDVARDFVSLVQAGDFEAAHSCWSPGSVATIERFSKMPFKDFCQTQFNCREFRIEPAVKQKGDYWSVDYTSNCDGVSMSYVFYVKAIDEVYCLTYERWEAPSTTK